MLKSEVEHRSHSYPLEYFMHTSVKVNSFRIVNIDNKPDCTAIILTASSPRMFISGAPEDASLTLNSIHFSKHYCNLYRNLTTAVIRPSNINKKLLFPFSRECRMQRMGSSVKTCLYKYETKARSIEMSERFQSLW